LKFYPSGQGERARRADSLLPWLVLRIVVAKKIRGRGGIREQDILVGVFHCWVIKGLRNRWNMNVFLWI